MISLSVTLGKTDLFNFFDQQISMKAIQKIDDEWQVVGKWCRLAIEENGIIDLWICNPSDMIQGLGTGKVNNMVEALKVLVKTPFTVLNGEAWVKLRNKGVILDSLPLLGIRKKRSMSDEQRNMMAERMFEVRNKRKVA